MSNASSMPVDYAHLVEVWKELCGGAIKPLPEIVPLQEPGRLLLTGCDLAQGQELVQGRSPLQRSRENRASYGVSRLHSALLANIRRTTYEKFAAEYQAQFVREDAVFSEKDLMRATRTPVSPLPPPSDARLAASVAELFKSTAASSKPAKPAPTPTASAASKSFKERRTIRRLDEVIELPAPKPQPDARPPLRVRRVVLSVYGDFGSIHRDLLMTATLAGPFQIAPDGHSGASTLVFDVTELEAASSVPGTAENVRVAPRRLPDLSGRMTTLTIRLDGYTYSFSEGSFLTLQHRVEDETRYVGSLLAVRVRESTAAVSERLRTLSWD
jgi:hypothetical protein